MTTDDMNRQLPWKNFYGPNLGYLHQQYEQYVNDPESAEPAFRELFARFGAPPALLETTSIDHGSIVQQTRDWNQLKKVVAAVQLVENIRRYGHLTANIDPLGLNQAPETRLLEPETYHLSEADLSNIPASLIWGNAPDDITTGWDAIRRLRQVYTKSLTYEFSHVHEESERDWLNNQAESSKSPAPLTAKECAELLSRLSEVEQFEAFLHKTFVGQKRFSIEGLDVLIPMLDEIVRAAAHDGAEHILMGMAHRGRLNVLAHVLGKPYSQIFSEFHHSPNKDLFPSEGSMGINYGWTGDVKYHLGADRSLREGETVSTRLTLANNPSHLEFVNSVVEGFARSAQEDRQQPGFPKQDVNKALAVLMHGDSAFPGEGIVAETLNFTKLPGYQNGGTIHIIVNNRIGFTTESTDSRSTHYASDLAKGYEIPIVHVNADDPEACIAAVRLACEYRYRYKKDFLIDLIGYRRYGHNEMDDPDTTQPLIYNKVRNHPTVYAIYAKKLHSAGVVNDEQIEAMKQRALNNLQDAYNEVKDKEGQNKSHVIVEPLGIHNEMNIDTAVPIEQLRTINSHLLKWPDGFKVYPKLQRILQRRASALDEGEKVEWALAETLAFSTILADGKPIRFTGQDTERGTFAHRHLILHDSETGETFSPLHQLPEARASFAIHNSPLSEASVLGFEYGYNVYSPGTLVLWEAQYGDFVNAAQVIIDQFISAGRMKWLQKSSLVLLLPHGWEGQGPEHSSARLERFLQLSAENNWTVANLTSAAQYFHLLRRQAGITESEAARPLVLMTPKSLIRNQRVASPGTAFSEGTFKLVLEQPGLGNHPDRVERLILSSGKIAIDLEEAMEKQQAEAVEKHESKDWSWLHMIRVEQLYPFPHSDIEQIISRFPHLEEIVWVQEEPQNMGSWRYIEPRLRAVVKERLAVQYVGRPERSSPASGYQDVYSYEQQQILNKALKEPARKSILSGGQRL